MKQLLFVEDDAMIAKEIINEFEDLGYLVTHLKTVAQTSAINYSGFSLVILDWNLPDGEGIDIVKKIRASKSQVPILMLTANVDIDHRKKALQEGADDFLGKPFHFHELIARVEILLSKTSKPQFQTKTALELGGIRVLPSEMKVFYKDNELKLKKKEYDLLLFFMNNPNIVFSRAEIIDSVWNEGEYPTTRTIDTHILNLRKKTDTEMFQTVWNAGYRFMVKESQ